MNLLDDNFRSRNTVCLVVVSTVSILLFVFASILSVRAAPANTIKPTISATGLAYVAMSGSNHVSLINTATHTAVGAIDVGTSGCNFPWRATMSPDSNYVYVSCYYSGNVAVIETTGNTVVTMINSIPSADDIAFTRDGAYALVGSRDNSQISVVNTGTMTVINTIFVAGVTRSLTTHPYLPQIYVTSGNGNILVVNTDTFTVVDSVFVGGDSWDVVVSPDGQWVFAGDRNGAGLHVIDAVQNTLYTTITGLGSITGLSIAPDSSQVYAAGLSNGVYIIDIPSLSLLTTVPVAGIVWETAVTCDGSELYMGSNSNSISVINIPSQTVIVQIPVTGSTAKGIATCPESIVTDPIMTPANQTNSGTQGEMVSHQLSFINGTDFTDSYTLTLGSHTWDSNLSQFNIGPVAPSSLVTFTVQVTVPVMAEWYSTDSVVIMATSVTSPTSYTATASVTTEAYAPPQIIVSPLSFNSTQFVNEVITHPFTVSNGVGVTMTLDIAEFDETTSVGELAYVTMSDSNDVALIDTSTQTAVGSIYVGASGCSFPWRATMSPDGSSVYVGCFNSGNVVVIDTASNTVVTTINSIPSADDIAFTPDGSYAFVGSRSVNQIKVIDTTTLTVISTISTPGETRSLAAHPTLDVIYATSGTGAVLVIDSNTFAIIDIISISAEPWDIAVTSDGQWLFTGDRWGSGLYVIDTASNSVFTIVTGLSNLTGLAVTPDNTKLYAASLGNGVHVIDIPSFTPITTIGNLGTVWETGVTCNGSELYIGNTSSSVPIVDTNTQTLITQVSVTGFTARGIAICPEHRIVNVPWLSTDPTSGILPTSSALPVTVTFNATNLQPDNYTASLNIFSNDPLSPIVPVPVTMTVQPTAVMGWIEGYITDDHTGMPLDATIIAMGQPYTITANANTGYYKLWLDNGSYTLLVTADGYVPQTRAINITAQQGTSEDFELVLDVARMEVMPTSLAVTQEVGDTAVRPITITNSGPATLEFQFYEQDTTPVSLMVLAHQAANKELQSGLSGLHILYDRAHDEPSPYDLSIIISDIIAAGGSFDENFAPVTSALLQDYDILWVNCCGYINWTAAELTAVANWLNQGGAILVQGDPTPATVQIASLGTITYTHTGHFEGTTTNIANHPIADGVSAFYVAHNGHDSLQSNSPDSVVVIRDAQYSQPQVIAHEQNSGKMVVLSGVDFDDSHINLNDNHLFATNTLTWLGLSGDIPWLAQDPISGTVAGFNAASVQVTFDATGLQPGNYTGNLIVDSNDFFTPTQSVAISMDVLPTSGMGQVMGDLTDAWTGQPLTATVQMVGVYTTTAGTDYSIWAEAGTYTLIATAPDYYTVTLPVTIEAGVTAVHDIALEPNLPRLELNTTAIETSLAAGFTTTLDLMLENTGPAPLIVSFYEISPTLSARPAAPADLTNIHILYDRAHDEEDPTYYSILVSDTVAAGATVDQNFVYPVTQAVLADYDILWVNCCGNIEWSFSELTAVANWLHQGGAILIHGDASNGTRLLPTIYDIMYDNGNYTGGDTTYIEDHPISSNVETVSIPGNYTRLVPGNVHSEVVVLDNNYQQPHIIAHEEGSGKMVVIADIDFHDYYINEAHNRLLANNVMSWLAIPSYVDLPWLSTTPETITIPGHSSATVAVQLDSTALAVGSYEGILALEHNDPNYTFPAQIPVTLNVATAVTALSLTPANQSSGGTPGSTHTYTFTLTNQGNHPDSFTIAVSSDWPATLSASNSGLLDLGEMATFVLTIDIPANAAGDDNATVTATSAFDTAVSTTATATTTLSQRFIYLPFISRSN